MSLYFIVLFFKASILWRREFPNSLDQYLKQTQYLKRNAGMFFAEDGKHDFCLRVQKKSVLARAADRDITKKGTGDNGASGIPPGLCAPACAIGLPGPVHRPGHGGSLGRPSVTCVSPRLRGSPGAHPAMPQQGPGLQSRWNPASSFVILPRNQAVIERGRPVRTPKQCDLNKAPVE